MIKELIIDLQQIENVLLYKVVQQDESFAGKGLVYNNGEVFMYSNYCKSIGIGGDNPTLYIDGVCVGDNLLVWSKSCSSIEKATEIKDKIEKCVADFNEYIRKENEQETEKRSMDFLMRKHTGL